MREPPQFAQIFAEHSLPPSYRGQVLGDLEERFRDAPRHPALHYCLDAVSAVSRVLFNGQHPVRLTHSDLRKRADAFQDSIWRRNIVSAVMFLLFLLPLQLVGLARATAIYPRALHVLALILFALWLRVQWTRGGARTVPDSLSEQELRIFHRAQLIHRRDFALASFHTLYASVSLWLALWLPIKWSAIWTMSAHFWGLAVFPFAVMLSFLIPRTRRDVAAQLQKLQHEIDELAEPTPSLRSDKR